MATTNSNGATPQGTANLFSTIATDPIRNFRFVVQFMPKDTTAWTGQWPAMGFVGVSGLTVATESIAYREGGYNTTVHQIPGQTSFQPISFSRGVMLGTDQNQQWMKQLFATVSGTANAGRGLGHDFRCNIDISVLSHPNPAFEKLKSDTTPNTAATAYDLHTAMRFRVYNAWINTLAYSDLSSGGNDLMVEAMSVVHEGWDLIWAKDYNNTAGSFAI